MAPEAPPVVMTYPDLDTAESAIDWVGLDVVEGGDGERGWFDGVLDDDAAARIEAACMDDETPQAVRALAATLRERWLDASAPRAWRVTYPA